MLVKVIAQLGDANDAAAVAGLAAELFDKDVLTANLLARSSVGSKGVVEFVFDITKASDVDSPGEIYPDLFVVVRDAAGHEKFRSHVIRNVRLLDRDATTGTPVMTVDLKFQRC